jgi:hypothetical protein
MPNQPRDPTWLQVLWLRPRESIRGTPMLFPGEFQHDHLVPGQLADQYLLSALGLLLAKPSLVSH